MVDEIVETDEEIGLQPTEFIYREKIQHNLVPIRFGSLGKPELKQSFIERYQKLLGDDYNKFVEYTYSYLNRSLRVNTLKISVEDLKKRLEEKGWVLEQVPWCKEAFWVENKEGRRDLGNTIEHQLGYFYIQEAASMIPPIALDPKEGDLILDCCASPGSKTSQISQMINNTGLVIANDLTGMRLAPLGSNIQRLGITNIVQVQTDFLRLPENVIFDKILLDAPCSGSGTIRKSIKTIDMWNPKMITSIANMQYKMIRKAWKILKKGGTLVYSTCSTDPEEDEAIISGFINEFSDAKVLDLHLEGFKTAKAVLEWDGVKYNSDVSKTLRVWPNDNDTEGFYVAKLIKT